MSYLTVEKKPNGLIVRITDEGREEAKERIASGDYNLESDDLLLALWNGWGNPGGAGYQEISSQVALEDGLIFSNDYDDEDDGTIVNVGDAYRFCDDAQGPVEILLKTGVLFLPKVEIVPNRSAP